MNEAGSAARKVHLEWTTGPRAWPELRQLAETTLHACAASLARHTSEWLGHLKLLLESEHGAAYCSITGAGERLSWRGALPEPASRVTVTLYGVVWGMSDSAVAAAVDAALAEQSLDWRLETGESGASDDGRPATDDGLLL
jgi:hypothetical protein